jgi:hypothetical protein
VPEDTVIALGNWFTVCVTGLAVLLLVVLLVSPLYAALRVCEPTESVVTASVATPALIVPEPRVVPLSVKVTVPVGLEPVTIALKVVEPPKWVGLTLEVIAVVEITLLTVCVTGLAVLLLMALLASPP